MSAATALAWAAAAPASASVPAGTPVRGWSVTPSPNPVLPTGQLFWVSCPAANLCVAVGIYVKSSGAGATLAERWDGSRWRIERTPSPAGAAWSALNGVSCVSRSACEAVGITFSRSGARRTVAERWNGTRWQLQPAPSPGGAYLVGVSCTSPAACTAVRFAQSASTLADAPPISFGAFFRPQRRAQADDNLGDDSALDYGLRHVVTSRSNPSWFRYIDDKD